MIIRSKKSHPSVFSEGWFFYSVKDNGDEEEDAENAEIEPGPRPVGYHILFRRGGLDSSAGEKLVPLLAAVLCKRLGEELLEMDLGIALLAGHLAKLSDDGFYNAL